MLGRKELLKEMKENEIAEKLKAGPAVLFLKKRDKVKSVAFSRRGRIIIAHYGGLPVHIYLEKEF